MSVGERYPVLPYVGSFSSSTDVQCYLLGKLMMFVVLLLNIVINTYGFYVTLLSSALQRSGIFNV